MENSLAALTSIVFKRLPQPESEASEAMTFRKTGALSLKKDFLFNDSTLSSQNLISYLGCKSDRSIPMRGSSNGHLRASRS